MLPATCPNTITAVQRYSWWEISVTVSAENVEKVVSPPKKPVVIARDSVSGIMTWLFIKPMNAPIRNPPKRLAANVPNGMIGKIAFIARPSHHRMRAPNALAIPIAMIAEKFVIEESPP